MDAFTRWQISENNFKLMDRIGKRMIREGHVLSNKKVHNHFCGVKVVWVERFGFLWRIVQIDGSIEEIQKLKKV